MALYKTCEVHGGLQLSEVPSKELLHPDERAHLGLDMKMAVSIVMKAFHWAPSCYEPFSQTVMTRFNGHQHCKSYRSFFIFYLRKWNRKKYLNTWQWRLPNYDDFSFWETQKYENGPLCALRMSPISWWMPTFCLSVDQNQTRFSSSSFFFGLMTCRMFSHSCEKFSASACVVKISIEFAEEQRLCM